MAVVSSVQAHAAAAPQAASVEELVVTAQRREENIQKVPMSVTALQGVTLEKRGAVQLADYLRGVPAVGMMSTGPAGNRGDTRQITIRGITPGASDPAFGFYLDDAPLPTGDPKLFDVDRVEVLRGPQGTLYGLGTSGGAIKIVPNAPNLREEENAFSGRLFHIFKGQGGYDINGMYNLPIIQDRLAVRFVGFHEEHGGYIDRVPLPSSLSVLGADALAGTRANAREDVNDESISGFRIAADWAATENLHIRPSFFQQTIDVGARPTFDPSVGDLQQARETDTSEHQSFYLTSLKLDYDLKFATLTSVTSEFIDRDRDNEDLTNIVRVALFHPRGLQFPGYAGMAVTRRRESFVEEVRLASSGEGRLKWLIGGFYQDQKQGPLPGHRTLNGVAPGLSSAATFFPFQADTFVTNTSYAEIEEKSAFAEASYKLTDRLTVTGGLRYFNVAIDHTINRGGYFNGLLALDGNPVIQTHSQEDGVRPKVSVSYQLAADHMIYATASQGFRRGGVNDALPGSVCNAELAARGFSSAPQSFQADSLWNYEAGLKSQFADHRVTFNATVFQIDWSKIQQRVVMNCGFAFTTNVGDARSRGAEIEFRARPIQGLDVSLGFGYTDAKITNVPSTFPSSDFKAGSRLQNVPKITWNAAAQYEWPINGRFDGFVGGDYQYVGDRLYTTDATQPYKGKLESYFLLNLRAGVDFGGKSLAIFVDNVTDERPILNVDSFGTTALLPSVYTLQPRTVGVSFRGSF